MVVSLFVHALRFFILLLLSGILQADDWPQWLEP